MQHDAAVQPSEPGSEPSRRHGVVTELSFKATFRWVRRAIHEAMDALEAHNLTAEEMASVEIVLAEALNNIVEHAYPQDAPGDVHLSLRLRGTGLLVEVRDQGRPMPNGRAPIGNHPIPSETLGCLNISFGLFDHLLESEANAIGPAGYSRADGDVDWMVQIAKGC